MFVYLSRCLIFTLAGTNPVAWRHILILMGLGDPPAADGLTLLHVKLIFISVSCHHLVYILLIQLLQLPLVLSLTGV